MNVVLATTTHGGHLAYFRGLTAQSLWYCFFPFSSLVLRYVYGASFCLNFGWVMTIAAKRNIFRP